SCALLVRAGDLRSGFQILRPGLRNDSRVVPGFLYSEVFQLHPQELLAICSTPCSDRYRSPQTCRLARAAAASSRASPTCHIAREGQPKFGRVCVADEFFGRFFAVPRFPNKPQTDRIGTHVNFAVGGAWTANTLECSSLYPVRFELIPPHTTKTI